MSFKLRKSLFEVASEGFLIPVSEHSGEQELVQAANAAGDHLLHVASSLGDIPAIKHLLELGAKVNDQGDYGYTALHYAAEADFPEVYAFLVQEGADEKLVNIFGARPSDLFPT